MFLQNEMNTKAEVLGKSSARQFFSENLETFARLNLKLQLLNICVKFVKYHQERWNYERVLNAAHYFNLIHF